MDLKTSFYVKNTSTNGHRLVFSTRTGKLKRINDELYNRLFVSPNLDLNGVPQKVVDGLVESKILVPQSEDEQQVILQENKKSLADNSSYGMTIAVTQFCNQDCIYCGQDNSVYKVLSDNHVELLLKEVRSYLKDYSPKNVSITFYGGEPSTAIDLVVKIATAIKQICDENGIAFNAKMITNGVNFTPKVINKLFKVNIRQYQITLDGPAKHHNCRRPLKTGEASFAKSYHTIKRLSKHKGVGITVRVNLDQNNLGSVRELLDLLISDGLQKKVVVDLAPVHSWGSDVTRYRYKPLSLGEYASIELDLLTQMVLEDFSVNLLPNRRNSPCTVINSNPRNGLVIDANGNFSRCWEIPYSEIRPHQHLLNKINSRADQKGLFEVGSLAEGVPKPNWLGQTFLQIFEEKTIECVNCSLLPSCAGGCPVQYVQHAKPLCPVWKYNLEGRIALSYAIAHVGGVESLKNQVQATLG